MIQGDFSLYVLIFPALPGLSAQSRLMMISTLKTLNPVEKHRAKTRGLKFASFCLKLRANTHSHMLAYRYQYKQGVRLTKTLHDDDGKYLFCIKRAFSSSVIWVLRILIMSGL